MIPPHVCDDLQLTQLLRRDAITVSSAACGRDDILARHEVFRSLDDPEVRSHFSALHKNVTTLNRLDGLLSSSKCSRERDVVFLTLMHEYVQFSLQAAKTMGSGVFCTAFSQYFSSECATQRFASLNSAADKLFPTMTELQFNTLKIDGDKYRLSPGKKQTYLEMLEHRTDELGLEPIALPQHGFQARGLSPAIINATARLYPSLFAEYAKFRENFSKYYDRDFRSDNGLRTLLDYRGELGFYLALCKLFDRVKAAGIPLNYPTLIETDERTFRVFDAYDITLLAKNEEHVVPNDILFTPDEPFFYLTGANGGGKTTYLRTVGVAAVLLLWGCPMPCASAEVYVPSCVFTHFPRDERFDNKGRSVDEDNRVDEILAAADGHSLVLLNETYSTTSEEKAVRLTGQLAQRLYKAKIYGLYITHQHGLAESDIPYLNVVIDRDSDNRRTFKVERRRALSGSFARDVLKKYGLTRETLEERFPKV